MDDAEKELRRRQIEEVAAQLLIVDECDEDENCIEE